MTKSLLGSKGLQLYTNRKADILLESCQQSSWTWGYDMQPWLNHTLPLSCHICEVAQFCALHLANICTSGSLLWRVSSLSNSLEFLWCSMGLLFIYLFIWFVFCQISSTHWWIFHKLNPFLQVTGIPGIAPIVSLQGGSRCPHHLLLQLSISPARDNLGGLTTFSITQKQSWVHIDGNGWWRSLNLRVSGICQTFHIAKVVFLTPRHHYQWRKW